jgi:hypothetical protein
MSQQAVFADIIRNSAVGIFFPKQKEQRHKQLGYVDIEINILTPKGFEGCVRVKLATEQL